MTVTLGSGPSVRGYSERPPTIVFEIVSPSDRPPAVHAKLEEYLEFGVAMAVAVWPDRRELAVGTSDGEWMELAAGNVLDLTAFVPGLTLHVAALFD